MLAAEDQDDPAKAKEAEAKKIATVTVAGIRGALEQSLETKRDAKNHVEVITAEDIGKMPDKNVADSLMRLPGVNTSSASANEGGFDENDRVSMRGTNPRLTQTLMNGHQVSSGDWFVLNQSGTVGRSVTYTLLPPNSSAASSCTRARKPAWSRVASPARSTSSRASRSNSASIHLQRQHRRVYADQPDKWAPQFSAFFNCEERRGHRRHPGAAVLREAPPAPRRPGSPGLQPVRAGSDGHRRSGRDQSRPAGRVVPEPHRLGALRAGAQARRRIDRHPVQADRKPDDRPQRLRLQARCAELQPQLHAVGLALHQLERAGRRLRGAQQHAGASQLGGRAGTQTGIYDQISRPDASSSSQFFELAVDWQATRR
jgi:iron complex outermembrane receptor protein